MQIENDHKPNTTESTDEETTTYTTSLGDDTETLYTSGPVVQHSRPLSSTTPHPPEVPYTSPPISVSTPSTTLFTSKPLDHNRKTAKPITYKPDQEFTSKTLPIPEIKSSSSVTTIETETSTVAQTAETEIDDIIEVPAYEIEPTTSSTTSNTTSSVVEEQHKEDETKFTPTSEIVSFVKSTQTPIRVTTELITDNDRTTIPSLPLVTNLLSVTKFTEIPISTMEQGDDLTRQSILTEETTSPSLSTMTNGQFQFEKTTNLPIYKTNNNEKVQTSKFLNATTNVQEQTEKTTIAYTFPTPEVNVTNKESKTSKSIKISTESIFAITTTPTGTITETQEGSTTEHNPVILKNFSINSFEETTRLDNVVVTRASEVSSSKSITEISEQTKVMRTVKPLAGTTEIGEIKTTLSQNEESTVEKETPKKTESTPIEHMQETTKYVEETTNYTEETIQNGKSVTEYDEKVTLSSGQTMGQTEKTTTYFTELTSQFEKTNMYIETSTETIAKSDQTEKVTQILYTATDISPNKISALTELEITERSGTTVTPRKTDGTSIKDSETLKTTEYIKMDSKLTTPELITIGFNEGHTQGSNLETTTRYESFDTPSKDEITRLENVTEKQIENTSTDFITSKVSTEAQKILGVTIAIDNVTSSTVPTSNHHHLVMTTVAGSSSTKENLIPSTEIYATSDVQTSETTFTGSTNLGESSVESTTVQQILNGTLISQSKTSPSETTEETTSTFKTPETKLDTLATTSQTLQSEENRITTIFSTLEIETNSATEEKTPVTLIENETSTIAASTEMIRTTSPNQHFQSNNIPEIAQSTIATIKSEELMTESMMLSSESYGTAKTDQGSYESSSKYIKDNTVISQDRTTKIPTRISTFIVTQDIEHTTQESSLIYIQDVTSKASDKYYSEATTSVISEGNVTKESSIIFGSSITIPEILFSTSPQIEISSPTSKSSSITDEETSDVSKTTSGISTPVYKSSISTFGKTETYSESTSEAYTETSSKSYEEIYTPKIFKSEPSEINTPTRMTSTTEESYLVDNLSPHPDTTSITASNNQTKLIQEQSTKYVSSIALTSDKEDLYSESSTKPIEPIFITTEEYSSVNLPSETLPETIITSTEQSSFENYATMSATKQEGLLNSDITKLPSVTTFKFTTNELPETFSHSSFPSTSTTVEIKSYTTDYVRENVSEPSITSESVKAGPPTSQKSFTEETTTGKEITELVTSSYKATEELQTKAHPESSKNASTFEVTFASVPETTAKILDKVQEISSGASEVTSTTIETSSQEYSVDTTKFDYGTTFRSTERKEVESTSGIKEFDATLTTIQEISSEYTTKSPTLEQPDHVGRLTSFEPLSTEKATEFYKTKTPSQMTSQEFDLHTTFGKTSTTKDLYGITTSKIMASEFTSEGTRRTSSMEKEATTFYPRETREPQPRIETEYPEMFGTTPFESSTPTTYTFSIKDDHNIEDTTQHTKFTTQFKIAMSSPHANWTEGNHILKTTEVVTPTDYLQEGFTVTESLISTSSKYIKEATTVENELTDNIHVSTVSNSEGTTVSEASISPFSKSFDEFTKATTGLVPQELETLFETSSNVHQLTTEPEQTKLTEKISKISSDITTAFTHSTVLPQSKSTEKIIPFTTKSPYTNHATTYEGQTTMQTRITESTPSVSVGEEEKISSTYETTRSYTIASTNEIEGKSMSPLMQSTEHEVSTDTSRTTVEVLDKTAVDSGEEATKIYVQSTYPTAIGESSIPLTSSTIFETSSLISISPPYLTKHNLESTTVAYETHERGKLTPGKTAATQPSVMTETTVQNQITKTSEGTTEMLHNTIKQAPATVSSGRDEDLIISTTEFESVQFTSTQKYVDNITTSPSEKPSLARTTEEDLSVDLIKEVSSSKVEESTSSVKVEEAISGTMKKELNVTTSRNVESTTTISWDKSKDSSNGSTIVDLTSESEGSTRLGVSTESYFEVTSSVQETVTSGISTLINMTTFGTETTETSIISLIDTTEAITLNISQVPTLSAEISTLGFAKASTSSITETSTTEILEVSTPVSTIDVKTLPITSSSTISIENNMQAIDSTTELPRLNNITDVQKECLSDDDCIAHEACFGGVCANPCKIEGICARYALCHVEDHRELCTCPPGFTGNPKLNCLQGITRYFFCKTSSSRYFYLIIITPITRHL